MPPPFPRVLSYIPLGTSGEAGYSKWERSSHRDPIARSRVHESAYSATL